MPPKKLFPAQIISNSAENYQSNISAKSQVIYITIVFTLLVLIISLPFVTTSISVKSSALIRPTTEISPIRSLANGRIRESYISENQFVRKGELLYAIDSEAQQEREKLLTLKKLETEQFINDLNVLIKVQSPKKILTPFYRQSYFNYQQKLAEAITKLSKVKVDYTRNQKLHHEKVIADAEFENHQFELDKAENDVKLLKQNQLSQWRGELRGYEKELQEFEAQLSQLEQDKKNLIIKAPVSGNVQNLAGIYPGSMVFANQELAQISPDTSLVVEAYINPNDIGLIEKGMPVRFQVDAFNYNQWGVATGLVMEVSNDVHIINERPIFKARCLLDREYLQLKNGYKGYLKKGMTLQARFMVTERTLWQLLYDNVDDWLNPNTFVKP